MFICAIPVMCSYAFGQLLHSEVNIIQSVIGLTLGTVVNIVLDPVLIFGFNLQISGAAMKIMTIGTFIFMVFSAACQPLVGYNYGCGNVSRVKEIIKKV
ncbi:MAG: hypothetical protein RSD77_02065 [Romboutsia sp.]